VYSLFYISLLDFSKEDDEKIAKKGWLKKNVYGVGTTQDVYMMRYFSYSNIIFVAQFGLSAYLLVYNIYATKG
jgi:hypothetical protein